MTDTIILYLIVGLSAFLMVFAIVIGLEKMTRVIVGNYFLGLLGASLVVCINILANSLGVASGFGKFIYEAKYIIVFIIYISVLVLFYSKSKVKFKLPGDIVREKVLYLAFVPLTVFSFISTISLILFVPDVLMGQSLTTLALDFSNNLYLQQYIINLPYSFLAYSFLTVFAFLEFRGQSPVA